jgi:DNA invertase Pin-like site-specific DNA recombinase
MTTQSGQNLPVLLSKGAQTLEQELNDLLKRAGQPAAGKQKRQRVAVYKRKSRMVPGRTDYSMEFQEGEAEAYIERQGWELHRIYEDPGRTGRNAHRNSLRALIADIKAGRVDIVLVYRLDRVFRNALGFLKLITMMNEYDVVLVSVTERFDTRSWWGRLLMLILAWVAELFIWQVSENTRLALEHRFQQGLHNGRLPLGYCNGLCSACTDPNGEGYCPNYGFEDIGDGVVGVPHPVDRHAVRLIFEWAADGWSHEEIAGYLNTHRFRLPAPDDDLIVQFRPKGNTGREKAKTRRARRFTKGSIREILKHIYYIGLVGSFPKKPLDMRDGLDTPSQRPPKRQGDRRKPEKITEGRHEAIISESLYARAQQRAQGRGRAPVNRKTKKRPTKLSGIGYCWECYDHLQVRSGLRGVTGGRNGAPRYRCGFHQDARSTRGRNRKDQTLLPAEWHDPDDLALLEARHHSFQRRVAHGYVARELRRLTIPEAWLERIVAWAIYPDGALQVERARRKLRDELTRWEDRLEMGVIDAATFEMQVMTIRRELRRLDPLRAPAAKDVLALLEDLPALWQRMEPEQSAVFLRLIFAGLYFDGAGALRKVAVYAPFDGLMGYPPGGTVYPPMEAV